MSYLQYLKERAINVWKDYIGVIFPLSLIAMAMAGILLSLFNLYFLSLLTPFILYLVYIFWKEETSNYKEWKAERSLIADKTTKESEKA